MPNVYPSSPQREQRRRIVGNSLGKLRFGQGENPAYPLMACILFWLLFYLNVPDNLDGFAAQGGVIEGNFVARNIKVAMILMSVWIIAARWTVMRPLMKESNLGVVAFLVLAPLSAAWSIDASATIMRFISLASLVLVCIAACLSGWGRLRFQQLSIPPLMFILVASLVVGVVLPDRIAEMGTDISQRNAWHGITHGKNEFGMIASVGAIICFNAWLAGGRRKLWALTGAAIAFTCLILSRSNGSLFATIVGVGSMVLVMRVPVVRRRYSTQVVIAIACTILLYELVIQDVLPGVHTLLGPIASLTGKDTTFSARTVIWKVIKEHIQGAPYLGTGYGAYWLGPLPTSPSYVFVSLMYFYPMESHNGYLEIVNDLGFMGLIVLLAFLFGFMRQALKLMKTDRSQGALYLALLFQAMVINMTESDWFSRSDTFAVLLLATICLSRGLLNATPPIRAKPTEDRQVHERRRLAELSG